MSLEILRLPTCWVNRGPVFIPLWDDLDLEEDTPIEWVNVQTTADVEARTPTTIDPENQL